MSALQVLRASSADAPALARLHALCFERAWDRSAFTRLLARAGAVCFLARRAGEPDPAGFVLFERVEVEAEILTFGVHPACRKSGVGAGLLTHGIRELAALGTTRLHLEVAADNLPALALYRAAGFTESGRRPAYYRREGDAAPADALVLSRRFRPASGH